jgi:hypothetical protein
MPAEDLRGRIRATLAAAYGEGLLTEGTLSHRLDQLSSGRVFEPAELVGDLNLRAAGRTTRPLGWLHERLAKLKALSSAFAAAEQPAVLALDWDGATDAVMLGRHPSCEVVLDDLTVSRRHAQLHFRDGRWILQDLGSKNGTSVNGARVMRCQLRAGDHLRLGEQHLVVD